MDIGLLFNHHKIIISMVMPGWNHSLTYVCMYEWNEVLAEFVCTFVLDGRWDDWLDRRMDG